MIHKLKVKPLREVAHDLECNSFCTGVLGNKIECVQRTSGCSYISDNVNVTPKLLSDFTLGVIFDT